MTIYFDTAWKGVTYVSGKAVEYFSQSPSDGTETEVQVKPLDLTKLVESISAALFIGMIAMKPQGTRIRIANNTILLEEPSLTTSACRTYATYTGTDDTANRKVFKTYRIFDRIRMAHAWFPTGSEGAIAIARIHTITAIATVSLEKLYADDYIPDHLAKNRRSIIRFISDNLPHKEVEELITYIIKLRRDLELPPDNQLTLRKEPVKEPVKEADVVPQDDSKSEQNGSGQEQSGSLPEQNASAPKEVQQQLPANYDADDDLLEDDPLSDFSEEDKKMVAAARDLESSKLMKKVYSVAELTSYASRMLTAWEHYQSDEKLVKEQVPGELSSLTQSIKTKITLYKKLLNQDLEKRY